MAVDPDPLGATRAGWPKRWSPTSMGVASETELTIEIGATNIDGFPETIVKVVGENAAALRFTDYGFVAG